MTFSCINFPHSIFINVRIQKVKKLLLFLTITDMLHWAVDTLFHYMSSLISHETVDIYFLLIRFFCTTGSGSQVGTIDGHVARGFLSSYDRRKSFQLIRLGTNNNNVLQSTNFLVLFCVFLCGCPIQLISFMEISLGRQISLEVQDSES